MKRRGLIFLLVFSVPLIVIATGAQVIDANGNVLPSRNRVDPAKEIYIAIRHDALPGSGTKLDPYDASTANKYTGLLTKLQPDCVFHYGPGVYETYGWLFRSRKTAGTGCKHYGAGIDRTVIRLIGAGNGPADGVVFASDFDRRADGFELHNLTIDCNASAQPKWREGPARFVAGVNTRGSNITIKKVKIVRFGTRSVGTECFPVFVAPYKLQGIFEDCIVEECVITNPATGNLDGVSTIAVASFDTGAIGRNLVARNNHVDLMGNDFLYSHGPYAQLTEGNFVKGCTDGFYAEPPPPGVTAAAQVRNNHYVGCTRGVAGQAHVGSMMEGISVQENTFIDCAAAVTIAADDSGPHFREILVQRNRSRKSDGSLGITGVVQILSTDKAIVLGNILDVSGPHAIYVHAARATVGENRTSGGELVHYMFNDVSTPQDGLTKSGNLPARRVSPKVGAPDLP